MDLGVQIEPQFGFSFEDIVTISRDAETAGFARVWLSDHLFLNPSSARTDCLETWTTLAALAMRTERIRIGPMVTAQSYRNPALLAKIAAGLDVMSGGRLEFGIGAGWKDFEYRAYGYDFPDAPTRVTQLFEALEICTRLWTEERATYKGTYYRVEDAPCSPKPAQRPLPIWIGGSKPRVMRAAARFAHAFNFNVEVSQRLDTLAEAMRALDAACASVRRDPKTVLRSSFLIATVGATKARADALLGELARRQNTDPKRLREIRPGLVAGTPDDALAKLREYARAGIAHVNLMLQPYGSEREQVAALAAIVPELARTPST